MTLTAPPVPLEYVGREQAYVKHQFLRSYLQRLVHKVASFANRIVYIDGFSGPWKSGAENYADTSFGIALKVLTEAKESWASIPNIMLRRTVSMDAHLVERDPDAFAQLQTIGSHFPNVTVTPYPAAFLTVAPKIAQVLPAEAFSFVLVDPTGFALDLMSLKPLLSRDRCEVVFNFMYDFANRFPSLPQLGPVFDKLLPGVDWRSELARLEANPATTSEDRKNTFLSCFKQAVRNVGGFKYVADVDIQYPGRERTFYFLVYGTRRPSGIEVFRDCQIQALEEQSEISGRLQVQAAEARGQMELLGSMNEMRAEPLRAFLRKEGEAAKRQLLALISAEGRRLRWDAVWPQVLADRVIRKSELGRVVNNLRKADVLDIPAWTSNRKQVPDDDYLIAQGRNWQSGLPN